MSKRGATLCAILIVGIALLVALNRRRDHSAVVDFLERKERWAIKTGADAGARRIRTDAPTTARVANLVKVRRPRQLPPETLPAAARTTRYSQVERTVYSIDADILRYVLEDDDHDFHLVIRDHGDTAAEDGATDSDKRRTMVVEAPDPGAVTSVSPWHSAIQKVRRTLEAKLQPGSHFTRRVIHARITGVGFFDTMHGQSGAARNGIELHPVLGVKILEGEEGKRKH